jgi:hypothetical protein
MRKYWLFFLLAAIAGTVSAAALAAGAPETADALPRRFKGAFKWEDRVSGSEVAVKFTAVSAENGLVWAVGEGRHEEDYFRTGVKIELVIDPHSLAVEMWEQAPEGTRGNPKFTTAGSYRGEISPDLKTIRAVWTTTPTGRKGTLTLQAN